jgi:hypothetical protein
VLVVSDSGNDRLAIFTLDGEPLNTAAIPQPLGIGVAGSLGLTVSSPTVGLRALSVEPNGFVQQHALDHASPRRVQSAIDVATGGSGVLVVDSASRGVLELLGETVQREVYHGASRPPLAVVGSARREVPAFFVADGVQVVEVQLPVPSPLPTVSAFEAALAQGDAATALAMIHPLQREDFRQIYTALGTSLGPLHGQQLGAATVDLLDESRAIVLIETTVNGPNGPEQRRIPMQLARTPDGGWQIYDY